MTLLFELSMPKAGSWDGKWSGDGGGYLRKCVVKKHTGDSVMKGKTKASFCYDFGDGWVAGVDVKIVTAQEANKLVRNSRGFAGYDWMIREILQHGRILTMEERDEAKRAKY